MKFFRLCKTKMSMTLMWNSSTFPLACGARTESMSAKTKSRKRVGKKCPPGYRYRMRYTRKSFRRGSGRKVKRTTVKAGCIVQRGKPGVPGGQRLGIKLKKGELKRFGYSAFKSMSARHKALARAIKEYGDPLGVYRKLNILATMQRYRQPELAKKFLADRNWVGKKYMIGKYRR
jgi:hypothetical protein